jgi:hypothetical protein
MTVQTNVSRNSQAAGREALRPSAQLSLEKIERAGEEAYERTRDLPRLIRLDLRLTSANTRETLEHIVSRLERALRAERHRARSGHWTYDLNRHIALRQAFRAEAARLAVLTAD